MLPILLLIFIYNIVVIQISKFKIVKDIHNRNLM